jgi:hypothetical protein
MMVIFFMLEVVEKSAISLRIQVKSSNILFKIQHLENRRQSSSRLCVRSMRMRSKSAEFHSYVC